MHSTYSQDRPGHARMYVIIGIAVLLFFWGLGHSGKKAGRHPGGWKTSIISLFKPDGAYGKKALQKKKARVRKAFRAADREIATLRR